MKYLSAFVLLLLLFVACTPDEKDNVTPTPVPDIFDNCIGEYDCVKYEGFWDSSDTTTYETVNVTLLSKTDSLIRIFNDTFRLKKDSSMGIYASQNFSFCEIRSRFHKDSIVLLVADRIKSPNHVLLLNGKKL